MPVRQMRRHFEMGVMDCVAATPEEYVDVAVRLGTEPDHRAEVRAKILAASDALFEDREAVANLEAFFQEAVASSR